MRTVHYDPFGSRLEGYRQGVGDEMNVQHNTRQAREADWNYQNMNPLKLAGAERQERLGQIGEPYAARAFGLAERQQAAGLFNNEQQNYERIGQATGNYAPVFANAGNYMQGTQGYLQNNDFFAPQVQAYNAQMYGGLQPGQDEYEPILAGMAATFGVRPEQFIQMMRSIPVNVNPQAAQGYDQFLGFDRARAIAQDQFAARQVEEMGQYRRQQAQTNADRAAMNPYWYGLQSGYATGAYGGGAGGYSGYSGADDGFSD